MEAVTLFKQQALAHRLERVDDLGKPVVIIGGFDEQLVVIRRRRRRHGCDRKQDRAEHAARLAGFQHRNTGGVAPDECRIGALLRRVVAAIRKVGIEPAALGELGGIHRELGVIDHAELGCEQRLAYRAGKHLSPTDRIARLLECGIRLRLAYRAMISIAGHRVRRARRHEVERLPVALRQVFLNRLVQRQRGGRGVVLHVGVRVLRAEICDVEQHGERLEQRLRLRGMGYGQRHRSERRHGPGQSRQAAHDARHEREFCFGEGRRACWRRDTVGGGQRILIARQ